MVGKDHKNFPSYPSNIALVTFLGGGADFVEGGAWEGRRNYQRSGTFGPRRHVFEGAFYLSSYPEEELDLAIGE